MKLEYGKFYKIIVKGGTPKRGLPSEREYRVKYLGEDEDLGLRKFMIDAGKVYYKVAPERIISCKPAKRNF